MIAARDANSPGPGRQLSVALAALIWFLSLDQAPADDAVDFGRKIRPILAEHCLACHGFDSNSRQADLRLDLRESAIQSGAINVENPQESLLLERIFSEDPEMVMPPPDSKKKLSAEQKELLKKWIGQSAPYEEHWAFKVPVKTEAPKTSDLSWSKNPIDQFVLKELDANGLKPAPPADPATLFRRLHFDITGLPPATGDLLQFLSDYQGDSERALSDWIDRLMARPGWGEHRARYWLDLARYADTHGMHFDNYREMWPYRDWVIRAFNANQPYDQFIVEQIAGDLLENPTTDQLIATGFQRCNITTNEGGTIEEENLALYAADRVQTMGWVFLGLTMNCAQCHDHKFDALTMKEYYGMSAFFRNTTQRGLDGNSKDGNSSIIHLPSEQDLPRWQALPQEISESKSKLEEYRSAAFERFVASLASIDGAALKANVRTQNLVLHVPFNDGSGEQARTSTGTSIASSVSASWIPEGKFGPAPVLTPKSTFLIGNIGNWEFDQSFSYGAWIKPENRGTSGAIIARMDTANRFRGWDLMQSGARLNVHLIDSWSDNSIKVQTARDVIVGDRWQHVFMTYDGTRRPEGIKIYVDGVSQVLQVDNHSLKPDATLKTETPARVGQRRADQFWSGSIQELRIYEAALSEREVAELVYADEIGLLLSLAETQRSPERLKQSFDLLVQGIDSEYLTHAQRVANLELEYNQIRDRSPISHIQQERKDTQPEANLLMRGEYDKKGDLVPAATPAVLHPYSADLPRNRFGLAKWLTDPQNPVTARVTVNRYWQELFGTGLVATPEDFGVMGSSPSHPELLDWLAVDFRESGWDVKRFYKQMLMSATYRQSSAFSSEKLERDPHNALLSRGPRFRMDGEMIRDFALATSGLLSSKMFGAGVKPYQPENIWNIVGLPEGNTRVYQQDSGDNLYRRSLYSFWKRMAHPPNMEILNSPSREVCVVKRERTNTPLQALVTLNDPIFVEAARNLAQRSIKESQELDPDAVSVIKAGDIVDRSASEPASAQAVEPQAIPLILNQVAMTVLSRRLTEQEIDLLQKDYNVYLEHYQGHPEDALSLLKTGASAAASDIQPAELAAWTLICQQFLNLDEAITK